MASESKEIREKQKAILEAKLKKRLAFLAEKGMDDKQIARDVLVKKLKSEIKKTDFRLRSIDANVKRTAELAAMKAERLARKAEDASKAKKTVSKEPSPAPEAKAKKKKKPEGEVKQKKA